MSQAHDERCFMLCQQCAIRELWSTQTAAEAAGIWHSWEKHTALLRLLVADDIQPRVPRPEELGQLISVRQR